MFISSTASSALRPRHGAAGGMRRCAVERVFDRDQPAGTAHFAPAGLQIEPDMGEQHRVDAIEQTITHLERLAGQQLLGDAGPQHQRAGQALALHQFLQRQRRGDVHRLAGIVTLAVAGTAFDHRFVIGDARLLRYVRQRIGVAAERDHRATGAPARDPAGRHAGDAALHGEAVLFQRGGQVFRCLDFVKAEFAEREQAVVDHLRELRVIIHRLDHPRLQATLVLISLIGRGSRPHRSVLYHAAWHLLAKRQARRRAGHACT